MPNNDFEYLIVGGGMVADAAARGIRQRDETGRIGILSEDMDEPYARPALSKKLWTDPDFDWDQADLHTAEDTGARIMTSTRVVRLDPHSRIATTEAGDDFRFQTLLIATGGHPKALDLPEDDRVILFRSANDYRRLRDFAAAGAHVAVVGGGFIGTELAAALIQNGASVTLVFPGAVLGGDVFPENLAKAFEAKFVEHGVRLRSGVSVDGGTMDDDGVHLSLSDGSSLNVDAVVSGLGIEPATELAEAAGIQVRDGIVVDAFLTTSLPRIFAAGDVANYPDRLLGHRRVEHVDNAQEMGRAAGRLMTGDVTAYRHTPYYYSDVFDVSYEAVGVLDGSLETIADWADPLDRGVVYYLRDGIPAGVLLWNISGRTDDAREVLAAANALGRDLTGRIPLTDAD